LTVLRAITRPDRPPASRVSWIAVIICLAVIGVVGYLFLGETSVLTADEKTAGTSPY
jgi:cardiolipin synthase A/B